MLEYFSVEDYLLSVGLCLLYAGTSCGGFECWVFFDDAFNVFRSQVSYSVEDSSVGTIDRVGFLVI